MTAVGPRLQTAWDWRAAGNFIGGGSGACLLCAAAIGAVGGGDPRLSTTMALILIAAGLGLVWLEISRPFRFLNVYRQPARSWMTREAYAALPVFAAGATAVWFAAPTLTVIAAGFGLISLYCEARILQAAKGIPTWREPALLPLVIVTGLTEGTGLFVLIAAIGASLPQWAPMLLALWLAARIASGSIYHRRLTDVGCPVRALDELERWKTAFLVLGHMLPFALLALGWLAPPTMGVAAALAAVCAVASGWALNTWFASTSA